MNRMPSFGRNATASPIVCAGPTRRNSAALAVVDRHEVAEHDRRLLQAIRREAVFAGRLLIWSHSPLPLTASSLAQSCEQRS